VPRFATVLTFAVAVVGLLARASGAAPIEVTGDGVWVVNPDSNTVSKLDPGGGFVIGEFPVGQSPRTLAATADHVYVANHLDDSLTRLDRFGASPETVPLGFGCAPYGVAAAPGGGVYVTCQGTSTLLVLDADLSLVRTVTLAWPEARAIALGPDGKAYVTHFITKEPNHTGHVSEVDPGAGAVTRVLEIPPDHATCETLGGGQGVANLLDAVAVVPSGAPAAVAGQLWVGGTLHNSLRKGLFERSRYFVGQPGIGLFPDFDFQSNPAGEGAAAHRNIYKPARHDIARGVVWKIDLASGALAGKIDVSGGGSISGIAFSSDGTVAHLVDLLANGYYALSTQRGQGGNPSAVFGPVSAAGPGGASPGAACSGSGDDVVPEDGSILAPQARLVPTGGMQPLDAVSLMPVDTGLEFTVSTGLMRGVPDGVGTTPIGVAVAGSNAFVASYLARNVVTVAATPDGFRCQAAPSTPCSTRLDCPGGSECLPLVRSVVGATASDPLPPEILDGKILFTTSARDAAGSHGPIPPFNVLLHDGSVHQGEVTSTARDGASLSCASCHADFGGQDGRTWDFSQFSSSLRNTMDLRGRASFAPGTCSNDGTVSCTFDAACGAGNHCVNDPGYIPPNIVPADRANYFNPMGSTHWNGDRDEVEDFEFTFRELTGASDCDGAEEKPETCVGALVVRRFVADPADARADLGQPNRNRSPRLNHLADYVYSLTRFPRNPNLGADGASPSAAARRGRMLFDDPVVHCSFCHTGPSQANQQFSDKGPNAGYDPTQTPRADLNSPFIRHDVGTANVFDQTNPFVIASDGPGILGFTLFQNEQIPTPGNRSVLNAYITSVLNDAWNTAPYLHDGSAPTLLDVVRPCLTKLEPCAIAGRGRNVDDQHGVTSFLSARQLNDLAEFEEAAHGPIVEAHAITGAFLNVQGLKVRFGKKAGSDALVVRGRADLSRTQSLDPASEPTTVSVGVPAGARMALFERTIPPASFHANHAHTSFRFADRRGTQLGGLRALAVKVKSNVLSFRMTAAGIDLSALRVRDPDYTVALEVGDDTVGATQQFRTNRRGTVTKGPAAPPRKKHR
jgi:hypothetical protein